MLCSDMNDDMAKVDTANPEEKSVLNSLKKTATKALAGDLQDSASAAGLSQACVFVAVVHVACACFLCAGRVCGRTQEFSHIFRNGHIMLVVFSVRPSIVEAHVCWRLPAGHERQLPGRLAGERGWAL